MLSQRSLYLMTVKLRKMGKNLPDDINPQLQCIVLKNKCFQQIFMGAEKKSKEIFRR